jgi:hypothetical protein
MRAAFVEGRMEDATRLLVMTRISRQPLVSIMRKPIVLCQEKKEGQTRIPATAMSSPFASLFFIFDYAQRKGRRQMWLAVSQNIILERAGARLMKTDHDRHHFTQT